ncbi:IS110 family transposase [Niabella sp.]|uniref:IS110 family transposase n=1 Tax=Niabella sp. TaxID=1962976 RepID=UPI00261970DB|nr:IS110 family transposase [Niabella sp.]
MEKIVKEVCGIDVAQGELVVALGRMTGDLNADVYAYKSFTNNQKGFELLLKWVKKLTVDYVNVCFVMEATGVYHQKLAYFLCQNDQVVSIVLPNKISNYFRTLDVKTVTDKTASEAITLFGLSRKLDNWTPPDPLFRQIRQLVRERDQLIQARTVAKNQLHAEQAEMHPLRNTIARFKKQIALLDKQIAEIVADINVLIKSDEKLKANIALLASIRGIGLLTAATVLAETNGFDLIRNKRQLTSYAGLDVKEKQSGTSVKGKSKISKRGNKYLRKALHMPALAAIKHDERFKGIFARLVSKHGIKMKAAVAVQRKLLEMMYTLYKKQEKYDSDYLKKQNQPAATEVQ